MTYFRSLPDIEYPNITDNNAALDAYQTFKNIFMRGKIRDDLQNIFTIFNKYSVQDGERPDQIAEKFYGDPALDWVVRVTANIVNLQDEFPLSTQLLYDYCVNKYGLENINNVRFWQTTEVRDEAKRLILPAGLEVDKDFTIPNPRDELQDLNPVIAVSNFEYERMKNDDKREIYILKEQYLGQFLSDMEDLTTYGFSSEYIDERMIRTTTDIFF